MAILIGTDGVAKIISKDITNIPEVNWNVERWPYQYMINEIMGSNGKKYKYDIYADETGLMKGLNTNYTASYVSHPHAGLRFPFLVGPCILVPISESVEYTMDDFIAIRDGTNVNEDETNEELVDFNSKSNLAVVRIR